MFNRNARYETWRAQAEQDNARSASVTAPDRLAEGESLSVRREGVPGLPSTSLRVDVRSRAPFVVLTPLDARRIGMALIEFAEECDGITGALLQVPDDVSSIKPTGPYAPTEEV